MEYITDIKDRIADAAERLSEGASNAADHLQSQAKGAWKATAAQTRRVARTSTKFASKHPVSTALVACGVGLALGLMLKSRASTPEGGTLAPKPQHRFRSFVTGAIVAFGGMFARAFLDSDRNRVAPKVADEPKKVVRSAKRSARKTVRRTAASAVILFGIGLAVLQPPTSAAAETAGGTLSLYMENDMFAGTDRQYTSGVKLGWSSRNLENYSDSPYASPFLPIFDLLPFINDKDYQKNLVLALGQNIYTPDDTESSGLVEGDRPYAGWLYLGVGVVWKNAEVRNSLVLNIGVVGSWAYGQEAQRLVHDARGLGHPNGWDNQLHNELGIVAIYQREWRWPKHERRAGLNWEFLPHAGIALGNVETSVNLGGELRAGFNLPDDFGTASIGPAATTSTPVDGRLGADRSRFDVGLYVFARVDGRLVAHNVFLDGNTFGNSASVDRNWLVADLSVGVAVNYKNTKFAYAFVYRTEEFDGQIEPQVFGTLSVNVEF